MRVRVLIEMDDGGVGIRAVNILDAAMRAYNEKLSRAVPDAAIDFEVLGVVRDDVRADARRELSDAQRAEIYREAARFLRSSDNPRQGDRTLAFVSYAMDDAGYELFQRAKRIEGA